MPESIFYHYIHPRGALDDAAEGHLFQAGVTRVSYPNGFSSPELWIQREHGMPATFRVVRPLHRMYDSYVGRESWGVTVERVMDEEPR